MKVSNDLTIIKADFVGTCGVCGQPATGRYDIDESPKTRIECVNCHYVKIIEIKGTVGPKQKGGKK